MSEIITAEQIFPFQDYADSKVDYTEIIERMNLFAKWKCKEQRKICAEIIKKNSDLENSILYAPEPLLELTKQ